VGSGAVKLSDEEYAAFVEKYGVRVWDYNISSADKPDMYEKMYGELYNLASTRGTTRAVFRITPGTNTVSALRRIFESVRSKDQLVIMSWDETTRNYTVR
jgi:hypothetical protein